jgi:hypothetical protein
MKNTNIGIANLVISNQLKRSYFNGNLLDESKKLTADFLDVVKNSPILQLEFKVFNGIDGKHIDNDLAATRYIDNNIKLFEVYTIAEIDAEREKLTSFLTEEKVIDNQEKIALYNAIDVLITESLNDYDKIDVDALHESFTLVLNHIKEPKKKELIENVETKPVDETVIEIAVEKFNERYDSLNEDDKNLLKKLIKSTDNEKQALLEAYKTESLSILEAVTKESAKEGVAKAIQKIREMNYKTNSLEFKRNIDDDIISLHELKKELL